MIKYIGFYSEPESKIKRVFNLAAVNKMNYVADTINESGHDVEFISCSWINGMSEKKSQDQKEEQ